MEEFVGGKKTAKIKSFFYDLYLKIKRDQIKEQIISNELANFKSELYNYFYEYANFDSINIHYFENSQTDFNGDSYFHYYLDSNLNQVVHHSVDNPSYFVKMNEILKFKLNSQHMKHDIEIFPVQENDFTKTIARFHLPCVRSFYDGHNVM